MPALAPPRSSLSRRALGLAALLLGLAACRPETDDLPTERRVALPDSVGAGASLRVDGRGRAWVVQGGRALVLDTAREARPAVIAVGAGTPLPAPAWDPAGRLYVERGREALEALARGGTPLPRGVRVTGPVARDPRGRWILAAVRGGGVVGLTPDSLRPAWGWPEAGPPAGAMAVSPLGDRVYLALDADEEEDRPPRVEVRDAQTGRTLSVLEVPEPVRALAAGPDGTLFGVAGAEEDGAGHVFALRHGAGGLAEGWRVSLRRLGLEAPVALRVPIAGARIAVFSRAGGDGGGLRLLEGATGTVAGQTPEAPLDAAWNAAGRLLVLSPREVRTVRPGAPSAAGS